MNIYLTWGCSLQLVTFGLAQQFGIIFRDYMYSIGISSSQLTTIINTQIAVSALTGMSCLVENMKLLICLEFCITSIFLECIYWYRVDIVCFFIGLLNGPLFRRFTYRQVALGGSTLIFLGMFLSVFAQSFLFYMMSFSFFYGKLLLSIKINEIFLLHTSFVAPSSLRSWSYGISVFDGC